MRIFLTLLCAYGSVLFASQVYSQAVPALDVSSVHSATDLTPYTEYAFASGTQAKGPEQLIAELRGVSFETLPANEISFGYTSNRVWLRITTSNTSENSQNLLLDSNVKYMRPLIIYEVSEGGLPRVLLRNDESSRFNERKLSYPKIVVPLQWSPGEVKHLYFYVGAGGGLALPLELSSANAVAEKYGSGLAFTAFFAGVLVTLILINLFHFVSIGRLEHLLYAFMEGSILLFVIHNEGYAFQYLWPDSPDWNAHATLVLGHSTNMFAALFSIVFLELRKRAPIIFAFLSAAAVFSFFLVLSTPFMEPRLSNQFGLGINVIGALAIVTAGVRVFLGGHGPAKYFLLGWLFMGAGAFVYGMSNLEMVQSPFEAISILKFCVLAEALLISYGLSALLRVLTDKVADSQQQLLHTSELRLQEAIERLELEEDRVVAEQALAGKDLELAQTSHDIRQPIHSLRLALLAQARQQNDPVTSAAFNRTLDHMEALLNDLTDKERQRYTGGKSTYGSLTRQLVDEFSAAALEGGIELNHVPSSLSLAVPFTPLKRVLSNLLSNALRHSGAKKILLGIRRRRDFIEILVVDNGTGINQSTAQTPSTGLGMGIISALCEEHDWLNTVKSEPEVGTYCSIQIPL